MSSVRMARSIDSEGDREHASKRSALRTCLDCHKSPFLSWSVHAGTMGEGHDKRAVAARSNSEVIERWCCAGNLRDLERFLREGALIATHHEECGACQSGGDDRGRTGFVLAAVSGRWTRDPHRRQHRPEQGSQARRYAASMLLSAGRTSPRRMPGQRCATVPSDGPALRILGPSGDKGNNRR